MLLAIAFLLFVVLLASWIVMPDNGAPVRVDRPADVPSPDAGTLPARA
jgi:hypothetical protein